MSVEDFTIASLSVKGGGKLGLCRLPGRSGELSSDVATLAEWKPGIVVSLTEVSEMTELGASDLSSLLSTQDIPWAHFPIVDFGVPSKAVMKKWSAVSKRLHSVLDCGQNVLLHCRGGLGRSGMVALRLLIERGEDFDTALVRLRAVRTGAVETDAQMAWSKNSDS